MNVHRFAIGQSVRLKGTIGMALQTGDMFRITGRMPARDWSPQYRISNDEGRHERVAEENNLEEVTVAASKAPVGSKRKQPEVAQQTGKRSCSRSRTTIGRRPIRDAVEVASRHI